MKQNNKLVKPAFAKTMFRAKETTVLMVIILLCIVLSILSPYFLTSGNIMTTLVGLSTDGIIAIGMTVVLAMGGIDLSVGSVLGLSAMVTASIARSTGNIWLGALLGIISALVCGLINGFFIAKVKLTPFIMTLAMMSIAKGATLLISSGKSIPISRTSEAFTFLGQGYIFGVFPFIVLILIVIAVIGTFLFSKTEAFRKIFYIGSNEKAARLSGINVTKTKMGVYILSSLLCGIAGVLTASRFGASSATTGQGVEMTAISAAVIGGASLSGGEGSVLGALLGIILLNIVDNGLVLLNVSVYGQDMISGLILLAAVTMDIIGQSRKAK